MGTNRYQFADDDDKRKPEPRIWVTRDVIAGFMVGIAGVAHMFFGFRIL